MFVRETGIYNISNVNLANSKNVKTDDSEVISEKNKNVCVIRDCIFPKPDVDLFVDGVEKKEIFYYEKNLKKQFFKDYKLLPEKFFKDDIPPPLVLRKWWKSLSPEEDTLSEESEEDSLPLIQVKNNLEKKTDHVNESGFDLEKKEFSVNKRKEDFKKESDGSKKKLKTFIGCKDKKQNDPLINRKRGRPRKSEKELITTNNYVSNKIHDTSENEQDDSFWMTQADISSWDILATENDETEPATDKKKENMVGISCKEHDYHKPNKEEPFRRKEESKKKTKKKGEKTEIQRMKIKDSKVSFSCFECGKSFSAASTLKHHIRIHNGSLLKCPECHRGFTTKYLLKCHMRIHNGDLFMCHKCGKGFTTAELLKVHSRGHTGDRPFACEFCEKTFPSASNLSQHKQTHETEKKFLCFQCGSSFSQKRCLDGHMVTHAKKTHICTVCGKLWARKSDLSEHMRVHTGVKPYCCAVCPQKFTQASSLKRHQIVHLNVKPIQCVTCNKLFKCQDYYKRHVRKHEKEADYLFNNIRKE